MHCYSFTCVNDVYSICVNVFKQTCSQSWTNLPDVQNYNKWIPPLVFWGRVQCSNNCGSACILWSLDTAVVCYFTLQNVVSLSFAEIELKLCTSILGPLGWFLDLVFKINPGAGEHDGGLIILTQFYMCFKAHIGIFLHPVSSMCMPPIFWTHNRTLNQHN